jgi:hypothetical protein
MEIEFIINNDGRYYKACSIVPRMGEIVIFEHVDRDQQYLVMHIRHVITDDKHEITVFLCAIRTPTWSD